jgi:outer membrane protein
MKHRFATLFVFFLAVTAAAANPARAQDRPPLSVAVVNSQEVGQKATAMAEADKKLKAIQQKLQEAYDQRREEIRNNAEELQARQSVMPPNVYQQRQRELNQEMFSLQQQAQRQRDALIQAWQKQVVSRFRETVVTVIQELSVERGYTLVVDRGTVMFSSPAYDITAEVIDRVNKRLPKLEFEFDQEVGPQGNQE